MTSGDHVTLTFHLPTLITATAVKPRRTFGDLFVLELRSTADACGLADCGAPASQSQQAYWPPRIQAWADRAASPLSTETRQNVEYPFNALCCHGYRYRASCARPG